MIIIIKRLSLILLSILLCSCKQEPTKENISSSSQLILPTDVLSLSERPTVPAEKKPLPIARIAARLADRLPHSHLSRAEFDDSIATNTLILFIDTFDFDRSYFLESDIQEFQIQDHLIDSNLLEPVGFFYVSHRSGLRYQLLSIQKYVIMNKLKII